MKLFLLIWAVNFASFMLMTFIVWWHTLGSVYET